MPTHICIYHDFPSSNSLHSISLPLCSTKKTYIPALKKKIESKAIPKVAFQQNYFGPMTDKRSIYPITSLFGNWYSKI